jgi:hypothetical protein
MGKELKDYSLKAKSSEIASECWGKKQEPYALNLLKGTIVMTGWD